MKKCLIALAAASLALAAQAQDTKVAIGMSGWTGFAPLTLALQSGLFKKHGLDASIKKIPFRPGRNALETPFLISATVRSLGNSRAGLLHATETVLRSMPKRAHCAAA